MPTLAAIYGARRDVTEYRAGWVLREMAAQADSDRLNDKISRFLQKAATSK